MNRSFWAQFRHLTCLLVLGMGALLLSACDTPPPPAETTEVAEFLIEPETEAGAEAGMQTISNELEAYEAVMSVLSSPTCSNCHPADNRPRQRDEQIEHLFNVTRGDESQGGVVQSCSTCHHEENNPYSNVPGAPHWGLAPHSMGWHGLSHAEIAQALIDPTTNGERSFEELIQHVSEDALVLWAWDPGEGRTPPPIPHDQFVEAMTVWLNAGAPIPTE